jgi:AraC-like DNA-binding protein
MIYRRLQNAIDYAESNLFLQVDFKEAAAEAYMSVATFYRAFEIFVGMSFMEYVRKRRLSVALMRLKRGESVTIIGYDLGYADSNSFSREFKSEFGLSPSKHAKSGTSISGQISIELMFGMAISYESKYAVARRNIMADAKIKNVLSGVKQICFKLKNSRGERYSPESFAFPACFTSAMRKISGEVHEKRVGAHNREYIFDLDYHEAMAVSGMAFGNLWPKNNVVSMSVNDFTQIAPRQEIFSRTFAWFGYELNHYSKKGTESEKDFFKELVVDSITAGKCVLATGLGGNPEFSLITGYDKKGEIMIGWSHYQDDPDVSCGFEALGECRIENWYDKIWEIVLFGNKIRDRKDPYVLLEWALAMLEGRELGDDAFCCGLEAYDAWMDFMGNEKLFDADEKELTRILHMHTTYTGQFAEARAWADSFFTSIFPAMLPDYATHIKDAAALCKNVHDLMWKVWGALGSGPGDLSVWAKLENKVIRAETISIINTAKEQDIRLIELIKEILSGRFTSETRKFGVAS